ncbi:DMT family transporter [Oceanibaculum indicum]|uniref:EamA-like transporter family protein n=1 Tax=Oceanibaculum indicum TaxID=526216 RepID=A0A420WAK5_9PROT|nr:DMT family transporter [Oceanibaculum indicum]RKQ68018.1 EamA-like transporter family protein [Oceanibaculum indicum]
MTETPNPVTGSGRADLPLGRVLFANMLLLGVAILWGSHIPVLDVLLGTLDVWTVALFRYLILIPVAMCWLTLSTAQPFRPAPPKDAEADAGIPARFPLRRIAILGIPGVLGFALFYSSGIYFAGPISAAIIATCSPVVATLVNWIISGTRPGREMWLAMAFAVTGGLIAVFSREPAGPGQDHRVPLLGEVLLVCGMICWSSYSVFAQRWLAGYSQLQITGFTMTAAGTGMVLLYPLLCLAGIAQLPDALPPLTIVVGLVYVALLPTLFGTFLWHSGIGIVGVPVAALYMNLLPIFAVLISMLIGTIPTTGQIVGGLVVLAGVAQAQFHRLKTRPT